MKKQMNNKNNQKNNSTLYLMWMCLLGIFLFIKDCIIMVGHMLASAMGPLLGGLACFLIGLFWKGLKGGINNFLKPDAITEPPKTVMVHDDLNKQLHEALELEYSKQLGILKEQETHKKLQLQIIERQREYKKIKQEKEHLQLQIIAREKELEKQKQQKQQEPSNEKGMGRKIWDGLITAAETATDVVKEITPDPATVITLTAGAAVVGGLLGGAPVLL